MSEETPAGEEPTSTPPASIDTDLQSFAREVEHAAPDGVVTLHVTLRAVILRRIDLDRGEGESFCEWIRTAVDERLQLVEYGDVQREGELTRSRPRSDTPDEEIVAEVSEAEADAWIPVTVEFSAGVLSALLKDCGERGDVSEWIRSAVRIRLSQLEREHVQRATVRVEVPPETVQRARLWAEYKVISDEDADYQAALEDALLQLVDPQTEFVLDGKTIASLATDECGGGEASP